MKPDKYMLAIDQLLRQMAAQERHLAGCACASERSRAEKHLKETHKRFEYLIPFPFRMQLRRMCKDAGIQGDFM